MIMMSVYFTLFYEALYFFTVASLVQCWNVMAAIVARMNMLMPNPGKPRVSMAMPPIVVLSIADRLMAALLRLIMVPLLYYWHTRCLQVSFYKIQKFTKFSLKFGYTFVFTQFIE